MFINQRKLSINSEINPELNDACRIKFGPDWAHFKSALTVGYPQTNSWNPRFGKKDHWMFDQTLGHIIYDLSDYQPISFNDATDLRFYELQRKLNDRPWIIRWSGGIDSTVAVVSILKNVSIADRQNYVIACNPASVWEAPLFFEKFIRGNFKIIDSTHDQIDKLYRDYYIIDGEPADCLWGSRVAAYLGSDAGLSWKNQPNRLLEFYSKKIKNTESANWFYELVKENILSVNLPVDTYEQWHWWINFNFQYIDATMRKLYTQTTVPVDAVQQSFINWYDSIEYNFWSLNQQLSNKNDSVNATSYKIAAKQYIHELFDDPYWYLFKTKGASAGMNSIRSWILIRDNQSYCFNIDNIHLELF